MCTPRASASTSSGWAKSLSIRSRTFRSSARSRSCGLLTVVDPGTAGRREPENRVFYRLGNKQDTEGETVLDNGWLYRTFEEVEHVGMRLGRNLWLDSRSLRFMIENSAADMSHPLATTHWDRVL